MKEKRGKIVCPGIAIGKIFVKAEREKCEYKKYSSNAEFEIQRYEIAKRQALEQLQELYDAAVVKLGSDEAEIFEVHQMMLEDEDFDDSVKRYIESEQLSVEGALDRTSDEYYEAFSNMNDEYFSARAADIRDISKRLLSILTGSNDNVQFFDTPVIVAAKELFPSETVQMDKEKVLSFVTLEGSTNSHTAILARTMGIPALIEVEIEDEWNGKTAIVDGFEGRIIIEPDSETLSLYCQKQMEIKMNREKLAGLKGKESITKDGKKISIYANAGNIDDLKLVLDNDAEGIGLFRSEFLYIGKETFPTEEEQFMAYKKIAESMKGKEVIIRTIDIGADKKADYFNLPDEENPALGFRAIRICLTNKEIFKTQLRAIFRASAYGNISIMYPMITCLNEILEIKKVVKEVTEELSSDGIPFGNVKQGIMIETPSAAILSDKLAPEVEFFSIGTNDLTQYTLAIDRQNSNLDLFYDAHSEAVLRLIEMTVKNAHTAGIRVGICGELGADLELTEWFLNIGVDELSVAPSCVLKLRNKVRNI